MTNIFRMPGRQMLLNVLLAVLIALLALPSGAFPSKSASKPKSTASSKEAPLFSTHVDFKQKVQQDPNNAKDSLVLTYLEINGWLLTMNSGMTILLDPILEGALDFGVPQLFKGEKRVLGGGLTEQLPHIDCLLLTQGLEDHAHVKSLTKLRKVCEQQGQQLPIVAPTSAKGALRKSGWYGNSNTIRFLDHGESTSIPNPHFPNSPLKIQATKGALVGPPWQSRQNGYVMSCQSNNCGQRPITMYTEPHVEFDAAELSKYAPVDVAITPTRGQGITGFELVHGPQSTLDLVQTIQPRFIVPMPSGDIDISGVAASLVQNVGGATDFEEGLAKIRGEELPTIVEGVEPGKDVILEL